MQWPRGFNTLSGLTESATVVFMSEFKSLTIRALQRRDRAEWAGLWRDYLAFYQTSAPPEVYAATFARLLGDDPRDFNALVAQQDGRLVGLTHYLFHRHAWKIADVCYLQDLYARPETRGTGIGRALIEAVYAAADAHGAASVYWLTQDFNTPARRLYDRIGVKTPFIRYNRR
jgi:GNAT superfamily N-acetyltransferase